VADRTTSVRSYSRMVSVGRCGRPAPVRPKKAAAMSGVLPLTKATVVPGKVIAGGGVSAGGRETVRALPSGRAAPASRSSLTMRVLSCSNERIKIEGLSSRRRRSLWRADGGYSHTSDCSFTQQATKSGFRSACESSDASRSATAHVTCCYEQHCNGHH
jgi:hypothetical protein